MFESPGRGFGQGRQGFSHSILIFCPNAVGLLGDIFRGVIGHADHKIGLGKIVSRAPHDQYGGDVLGSVELFDPVHKGGDGLFVSAHQLLHFVVSHHEVGGGGVLIQKKGTCSGLHAFADIGRLGGAAAGIFRGEGRCGAPEGEVVDEGGDIGSSDASAVGGANFEGHLIGDHPLPPVAWDVIVNPAFKGVEKGGLPVKSPAHNQGDP